MNRIQSLIVAFFIGASVYAKAPVMESFVPTEWMMMNELKESEIRQFIDNHKQIFDYCEKINFSHLEGRHFPEQNVCLDETKIFKELVNGDLFYWILIPGNRIKDTKEMVKGVPWVSEKHYFLGLVRVENDKDRLLFFHPTLNIDWDEKSNYYIVRTFQIIKGKNKNKGIVYYENRLDFYRDKTGTKFSDYQKLKGQAVGHITKADYFLFENEPTDSEYIDDIPGFVLKNWKPVRLFASDFLWDLNNPLKYGLQNAFDQDINTSYVENTNDDLLKIEIMGLNKYHPLFAIINGYAQSEKLYKDNNRVKLFNYDYRLSDEVLDYQFIKGQGNNKLIVKDFYKGLKFSDTCIAELNMKPEESDWIFGDLND